MSHFCTIIPPHISKAVVASADVNDSIKHCHRYTLDKTASIRNIRLQNIQELHVAHHEAAAARGTKKDTPTQHGLNRTIYDFKNSEDESKLPGKVIDIKEGGAPVPTSQDKTGDPNEAYTGFGDTYNFYKQFFNRNSIDNKGLPLIGTVHFGVKYQNAFWDGKQMVFGDGDGEIFLDFTSRADVIAHELTHGVTQYTANLDYQGQSGALNESVSDVFGIMVKQWASNEEDAKTANWLIGEGIWGPTIKGRALRDMQNPGTAYNDKRVGKDPQPANMSDYQDLPLDEDNDMGGVHINSGIPNKAFYEAATRIGGASWTGAGPIWYKTLTGGQLPSSATFQQFADLTYKNAGDNADAISAAWNAVGITITGASEGGNAEQPELK